MDDQQGQERTERPTPKRLRDAKRRGQVPRSRELNTAMMLMAAALALYLLGGHFGEGLMRSMRGALVLEGADLLRPEAMLERLAHLIGEMTVLFVPFLLVMLVVAVGAPALLGGWTLSGEALTPKLERLDPLKGLGRIFSLKGLIELVKAIAKLTVVAVVAGAFLWLKKEEILAPPVVSVEQDLVRSMELFGVVLIVLAAATFLIAAVDIPLQLWDHQKKLHMTRQEVRDELKDSEGRPEVKSRIRQLQHEYSKRRMMDEVPTADVVVTNPTHYAVALRYEPLKTGAPRVVAKGADLLAMRIRLLAKDNEVPVVEAPPLARALYRGTKVGQEIPESLYLAVAQLLAYVYQVRTARERGTAEPRPPADLEVPDELAR